MSAYQLLLLFFSLSIASLLWIKSTNWKKHNGEHHLGWNLAFCLFAWLYADKFVFLGKNFASLKDLNRWLLYLTALFIMVIYAKVVEKILMKIGYFTIRNEHS